MVNEINLFKSKEISSFGGKKLEVNLKEAEKAIAELSGDFRIHNHSNTQFTWTRFILSHKGGLRNIRQISAEINKKKLALHEAKHRYIKQNIKLMSLREKLTADEFENKYEKMTIEAEISEIEENLEIVISPIEGAIKDILTLKSAYDEIIKQHPNYTEEDLEREEIAYWIRRLFSQALRDMRQSGVVMHGNQEAIEQMGFNMSYIIEILNDYLNEEKKSTDSSGILLAKFLDWCVEKYAEQVSSHSGYGGFSGDVVERSLYYSDDTKQSDNSGDT